MKTKHLILDLDNTLYNWVDVIVPAVRVMVQEASKISGIPVHRIYRDLRRVHIARGTIEHPYALLEAKCIQDRYGVLPQRGKENPLDEAFHAFNSYRKHNLRLYPGVREFLELAKSKGISLIAFSEAQVNAIADRIARLEILNYFDAIYCVAPKGFVEAELSKSWFANRLNLERLHLLDFGAKKPNPALLNAILSDQKIDRASAIYVGDSLFRDVAMANDAQVRCAWARYGTVHHRENARLLVKVTHWTDEEIEDFGRKVLESTAKPDLVLNASLLELSAAL